MDAQRAEKHELAGSGIFFFPVREKLGCGLGLLVIFIAKAHDVNPYSFRRIKN